MIMFIEKNKWNQFVLIHSVTQRWCGCGWTKLREFCRNAFCKSHRTAKKKNGWQMAMTHWCTNVHTISVTTWNMSNSLGNSSIRSIRTIHVWWRILYMEFPIEENLKDRNREAYENQIHRIFRFFYPKYTQMVFVQYFVHHYAVFYEIFASDCVYLPIYMNIEQHTAFGRHGHWTVNTL